MVWVTSRVIGMKKRNSSNRCLINMSRLAWTMSN